MKALLKQLILLTLGVALIQVALIGITYLLFPPLYTLDTFDAPHTIYRVPERLDACGVWEPALRQKRNVIVLGTSNSVQGFRPEVLGREFPDFSIHNMALNGTNVTETRLAVDLANASMPPRLARQTIYVCGVWYGLFVDNAQRDKMQGFFQRFRNGIQGGEAGLKPELVRWSPLAITFDDPVFIKHPVLFGSLSVGMRPYLEIDRIKSIVWGLDRAKGRTVLQSALKGRWDLSAIMPQTPPLAFNLEDDKELNYWISYMGVHDGELNEEQFDELTTLTRHIADGGAYVILVDMPLPEWHKRQSKEDASYRRLLAMRLPALTASKHVAFVSLEDTSLEFADSVHPLFEAIPVWSEELAKHIRPVIDAFPSNTP